MEPFFYYSGIAAWAAVALLGSWLAVEIVVGFVTAVSWSRWVYLGAKKHGRKLNWRRFPDSFVREWFGFIGYRNRGRYTVSRDDGSVWRGIGDWSIGWGPVDTRN